MKESLVLEEKQRKIGKPDSFESISSVLFNVLQQRNYFRDFIEWKCLGANPLGLIECGKIFQTKDLIFAVYFTEC